MTACPGCGGAMGSLALERRPVGSVTIDVCGGCRVLWFDAFESVQLTPRATLELFRAIGEAGRTAARPLPATLRCPRCARPLLLTHDVVRTTRFSYLRCAQGHGRLTPFVQFLREKGFVRPLAREEIARLKDAVRTVRCSGCGAPVDLAAATACAYCGAPIEILDPQAVAKTFAELSSAEPAKPVDVELLAQRFAAAQRADAASARLSGESLYDLVAGGLGAMMALWTR